MSHREEIYAKLRPKLVKVLMSRHGMRLEDSEDVVQETMLILHKRYGYLEEEAMIVPLAFKILSYKRLEFVKKERRYGELPENFDAISPDPDPEADILAKDAARRSREWITRLRAIIPGIKEECRKLLELRLKGLSTAEIAAQMNITPNYVFVHEHRCRKSLRVEMNAGDSR